MDNFEHSDLPTKSLNDTREYMERDLFQLLLEQQDQQQQQLASQTTAITTSVASMLNTSPVSSLSPTTLDLSSGSSTSPPSNLGSIVDQYSVFTVPYVGDQQQLMYSVSPSSISSETIQSIPTTPYEQAAPAQAIKKQKKSV